MLPTFVIGLREGLEAALVVGIIAAFLRRQGRSDLVRSVVLGVGAAVLLCVAAGGALELYSRELPQRQQESLETVIGALAVGMVTYMVVWMRRHSRHLKGQLEGLAAQALGDRSRAVRAMIAMAFLAVIREGLETVVFLLAAFNEAGSGAAAGAGAVLGLAVAVGLGYGIYRGGVRLNLSRFFRVTGLVLVLVAAGLVVNALHTAHEAGWLDVGQTRTADLSWLVEPGTVQASLLTGMLGIQPHPTTVELIGWLVYLVPVGLYVAWPPGRRFPARALAGGAAGLAGVGAVAAVVLALLAPGRPAQRPVTAPDGLAARVVARDAGEATLRISGAELRLRAARVAEHRGIRAAEFRGSLPGEPAGRRPAGLTAAQVAAQNGGRLPLGLVAAAGPFAADYRSVRTVTAWLDVRTDRVLDVRWDETVSATVRSADRWFPLGTPVAHRSGGLPADAVAGAVRATRADHDRLGRRTLLRQAAGWTAALGVLGGLVACGCAVPLVRRRREPQARSIREPVPT